MSNPAKMLIKYFEINKYVATVPRLSPKESEWLKSEMNSGNLHRMSRAQISNEGIIDDTRQVVERINTLETSKQLMEADLLKKAEQTPKNLEMLMLIEMNAKIIEKHQVQLDENIHTKVLLTEANKKIDKLQEDVEKLIRKNGNH